MPAATTLKVVPDPVIVMRPSGCATMEAAAPDEELDDELELLEEELDEDELDELLLDEEEELLELEDEELELEELLLEEEEELEDEELEEEELPPSGVDTEKPVKFIVLNWFDPPPKRMAMALKVVVGLLESVAV